MTIQEAAYQILQEEKRYLTSREIARHAIERRMVTSNARDQIQSLAQTIEKNIRGGAYNNPELCFAKDKNGQRVIGIPRWHMNGIAPDHFPPRVRTVEVTEETIKGIELAREAKLGESDTEVLSRLVRAGFKALEDEIRSGLSTQFAERQKQMDEFMR